MASSGTSWGIEIGAYALKAIKLEATGDGKCKVVDHAIIPHAKVLSTPGVDANDVVRLTLGQFNSQYDTSKSSLVVSIPGHSSFARFAKLPPVEPKKVPGIVKFEAAQQIPFPLEQVEWDYQTFITPDSPDIEAGIFAVTKERVAEKLAMLSDVGLTPTHVALGPIAVYNALAYDLDFDNTSPGTIIVDVGTTSTDLVVATPGRMWVRTFPLGGHQFTEALVSQFQLSYPKAEKLKREAQDTKHARQVFQAMRPVFTDLAQDIQRSIGYFQSINKDAALTRVIGVGNTFRLPGLRKYLKQQLGMDIYRVEQFKKIGSGAAVANSDDDEGGEQTQAIIDPNDKAASLAHGSLELVSAYGLALQGLGLNAVSCNLMPVEVTRKAMWKGKTKWFLGAAGVALAASAVLMVGPVQAHFASSAAVPDPSIQQALNLAKQIKGQAEEAGVTKSDGADLKAANLLKLQDRAWVYPQLTKDIQDIFAYANERAQTWGSVIGQEWKPTGPAVSLTAVEDFFVAPSPDSEIEHRKFPGVEITVAADLRVPEARRFATETIARWLRDNATREGVDYVLVFNPALEMKAADTTGAQASAANNLALPGGAGGGGGRETAASGRGRDDAPGGARTPGAAPGRNQRTPGGRQPAPSQGRITGEGPSGNVSETTSPDAMAPLAAGDMGGPVLGRVTFRFTAFLKPYVKPAPAEGAAEGGAAGGAGGANSGGGS